MINTIEKMNEENENCENYERSSFDSDETEHEDLV